MAPPGSGKTVMGCALIPEPQGSTAILVNRAELLQQWRERLTTFLGVEDHQSGQLGNGRQKRKSIIDLIMMHSTSRRDSGPPILEDYRQIIVDECHAMETQAPGNRELVVHKTTFTTDEPGTVGPLVQATYSALSTDTDRNRLMVDQIPDGGARAGQAFRLLSIDKIAGEGFDIPAMDTLFLTMPISFKDSIIQQAGRVTRDSTGGPAAAVVHDFRDLQVPMLERMHQRRFKILQKNVLRLNPS